MSTLVTARPAPRSRPLLLQLPSRPTDPPQAQPTLPDDVLLEVAPPTPGIAPDAERAARAATLALVETLSGQRPLAQLRPLLAPRVAFLLEHLVRSGAASGMRLAGLRVQSPRDGVVEASARLASVDRSSALALRLERRPLRWAVTSVEAALAADGRWPARS